jgi:hypothetical protein
MHTRAPGCEHVLGRNLCMPRAAPWPFLLDCLQAPYGCDECAHLPPP